MATAPTWWRGWRPTPLSWWPGPGRALNDVRLAARALSGHPLVVYLNHFSPDDEIHVRNRRWLADRDGLVVAVNVAQLAGVTLGTSPR